MTAVIPDLPRKGYLEFADEEGPAPEDVLEVAVQLSINMHRFMPEADYRFDPYDPFQVAGGVEVFIAHMDTHYFPTGWYDFDFWEWIYAACFYLQPMMHSWADMYEESAYSDFMGVKKLLAVLYDLTEMCQARNKGNLSVADVEGVLRGDKEKLCWRGDEDVLYLYAEWGFTAVEIAEILNGSLFGASAEIVALLLARNESAAKGIGMLVDYMQANTGIEFLDYNMEMWGFGTNEFPYSVGTVDSFAADWEAAEIYLHDMDEALHILGRAKRRRKKVKRAIAEGFRRAREAVERRTAEIEDAMDAGLIDEDGVRVDE